MGPQKQESVFVVEEKLGDNELGVFQGVGQKHGPEIRFRVELFLVQIFGLKQLGHGLAPGCGTLGLVAVQRGDGAALTGCLFPEVPGHGTTIGFPGVHNGESGNAVSKGCVDHGPDLIPGTSEESPHAGPFIFHRGHEGKEGPVLFKTPAENVFKG